MYKAVFQRAPEPTGWNYWKGVYQTRSLFDIAGYFVLATEFTNRYGSATNAEFVDLIYRNVMGRVPDPAGYAYWLGLIDRGEITRAGMVVYFSESAEFRRRENDLYFERCPMTAPPSPTVMASTGLDLIKSVGTSPQYSYTQTLDAGTDSSAHSFVTFDADDDYVGRRRPGEQCVTWKVIPYGSGTLAGDAVFYAGLPHSHFFTDARSAGPWPITDPEVLFSRMATFAAKIDEGEGAYPIDNCEPEPRNVALLASGVVEVLPDVAADELAVAHGLVNRGISLDVEELRTLLSTGEPVLATIAPSMADDLEIVDANNAALRDAGYSDRADDRIQMQLDVWEDRTGNAVQIKMVYQVFLTQPNLEVFEWRVTSISLRMPPA